MEPRKNPEPGGVWKPLLLTFGVFGLLCAVAVWYAAHRSVPMMDRTKSQDNISSLLHGHRRLEEARVLVPVGGKAYLLWLVVRGEIEPDVPGALHVLFSPADDDAPETPPVEAYRELTEARLLAGADVRHLTSYVGPRREAGGKLPVPGKEPRPMIADLHIADGAMVGFSNGRVSWLTRGELGLGPDDPIVAGPESKSPILRQLSE